MAVPIQFLLQHCKSLQHIKQLHSHLTTTGLLLSPSLRTKLLELCAVSTAGNLTLATQILDTIQSPSINESNTIIRRFANSDTPKLAVAFYQFMPTKPDALSCSFALKACKIPSFLTLPFFKNPTLSPKFPKLRAKATINDEFVLPQAHSDSTFYELLGISNNVGVIEIKQAYKQLARKYHPDVSPPDRAEEYTKRFILVQEAYETLSDPNRRALYDRDMSRGLHLAFQADVLLVTTLLDVYAKVGDLGDARKVCDEMGVRDTASWNALIAELAQGSRPGDALGLFRRMREEGFKANEVTVLRALM